MSTKIKKIKVRKKLIDKKTGAVRQEEVVFKILCENKSKSKSKLF